uniref:protein NinF n=1 Tax=Pedobacter arcticus TaxID=752140 RepID=UPI00373FCB9C
MGQICLCTCKTAIQLHIVYQKESVIGILVCAKIKSILWAVERLVCAACYPYL